MIWSVAVVRFMRYQNHSTAQGELRLAAIAFTHYKCCLASVQTTLAQAVFPGLRES